jgi:hypothetical protein
MSYHNPETQIADRKKTRENLIWECYKIGRNDYQMQNNNNNKNPQNVSSSKMNFKSDKSRKTQI